MKKNIVSLVCPAVLALLLAVSCHNNRREVVNPASEGNGTASSICAYDPDFDTHFTGERLRIDLVLAGDSEHQEAYFQQMYREPRWSGSPSSLINRFGYGQYFCELFSADSLVYSTGFSTLFEEWRTTPQSEKVKMAANQTVWVPFPRDSVHFVLYRRVWETGKFDRMLEFDIDPSDRHIIPASNPYRITTLHYSGDPAHKVDLVFAGEGYTAGQMSKFRSDARRMTDYLFSMEPYAHRADDFNVWLVESVSQDSGPDIPQDGVWRSTIMDSGYDTFYEDRYLTIMDHRKIADAISCTDFDTVFIIANDPKYGGGGIFNSYAMGSSDHKYSDPVFIHEFGHSFAGLGDEYYDSSSPYEDFYNLEVEPWEPNVTTMVDFQSKWADMIAEDTPVPTPNDPENYYGVVGAFEGAGYMTEGCWRPYYECRMFNNTAPCFCPVCQRAIEAMIDFYAR